MPLSNHVQWHGVPDVVVPDQLGGGLPIQRAMTAPPDELKFQQLPPDVIPGTTLSHAPSIPLPQGASYINSQDDEQQV